MDAGFLNVVEIGQYFMTKDTAEFSQFHAVACREYTLPRKEASPPKGWIQGSTKIGPVLEVSTFCLHGKYGVEIRISSVNRDNTHSWVRISHGSNKFVLNLNNNEQEIPEVQLEEYALKLDANDFACRSKAEAKPQRREPAGFSLRTIPIEKRTLTDVEPGKYSLSDYGISLKLIHLLRDNMCIENMMEQFNSGELKKIFRHIVLPSLASGRKAWQEEENMLNDQKDKLCNHQEVSNRANQFQTHVVIDRTRCIGATRCWNR